METLNLFKSIKNISYLTAFACLSLSSAHSETTPQQIIEAYAEDQPLSLKSGNVLAYKNIEGKTIVLKSGNDFAMAKKGDGKEKTLEYSPDVNVVSLEEVVKYTTGLNDTSSKDSNLAIGSFGNYCKEGNDAWYTYISSKNPYRTAFTRQDPIKYIQTNGAETLHKRLGNFRHTEIQIQALWEKYNNTQYDQKTINGLRKKSKDIENLLQVTGLLDARTEEQCKNCLTKERIKPLLPTALVEKTDENNPNHKIYSLFEACDACEKINWLKDKKGIFMFAILDGQFTRGERRHKVKDKNAKKPEEKKVVFMSQKDLEDKKIKALPDINEALKEDFEPI